MPELPEVETSRRGIEPHILHQKIVKLVIREHKLRWPIPRNLPAKTQGLIIQQVARRGKYLLLAVTDNISNQKCLGTIIIHLGMSGSLRICPINTPAEKHDHIDFVFNNNVLLRFRDPRKFGCVLWTARSVDQHKLLHKLGPEPLDENFDTNYLFSITRKRSCSIKSLIMNSHIVVGVGNIYASESLHLAGISPRRKAGSVSKPRCEKLVDAIRQILSDAITQGGTTLRDFTRENGQPGYFAQKLLVYGRATEPCGHCGGPIKQIQQQQRSTYYCPKCQK